MQPLTYYVAATLDGFIADPNGSADVLPREGDHGPAITAENPETLPAHISAALALNVAPRHFDTVLTDVGPTRPGLRAGTRTPIHI